VLEMFDGALGGDGPSLKIAWPKYAETRTQVARFVTLLELFASSSSMATFDAAREALSDYAARLRKEFEEVFAAPDLRALYPASGADVAEAAGVDVPVDFDAVSPEHYKLFTDVAARVKDSDIVKTAVVTCKNLVDHKKALEDEAKPSPSFLIRSASMSFTPLPELAAVNFKAIYISDRLLPDQKQFVLRILCKLYAITRAVYDAVSAPDVDVEEFSEIITASLADVKKLIPRCDEAFDKLAGSVDLLKGNFNDYWSDSVAAGNKSLIMENFVLDVSRSSTSSPQITRQFRQIISFYRKQASMRVTDPRMRTVFAHVDKNFSELERKSSAAAAAADEEGSVTDEEDAATDEKGGGAGLPGGGAGLPGGAPSEEAQSGGELSDLVAEVKSAAAKRRARKKQNKKARAAAAADDGGSSGSGIDEDAPPAE
jgi:hypothetical protein